MIALADVPARPGARITPQIALFAAILFTVPFWLGPVGLCQYLGVELAIWMIYALGFNLLFGYAGLHSFGYGAYFGCGAYAFGLFQHEVAVSLLGGLGAAILAGLVAGIVVGAFVSHRRGIYFALMTIAFGQVFWFVSIKAHGVTGGEDGLPDIPRPPVDLGFVSFDLSSNVALLGPSGAGKTTTIRSILGLTPPRRGAIRFDGEDVTRLPTHRITSRGISWVPDDRRIIRSLTVSRRAASASRWRWSAR